MEHNRVQRNRPTQPGLAVKAQRDVEDNAYRTPGGESLGRALQRTVGNQVLQRLSQESRQYWGPPNGREGGSIPPSKSGTDGVVSIGTDERTEPSSPAAGSVLQPGSRSRHALATTSTPRSESTPADSRSIHSPGDGLPPSVRSFFEPRLGERLDTVRVHTDGRAAALSEALDARAFTSGDHVYFADGAYSPKTAAGRRLLAHELAHTIQQRRGVGSSSRETHGTSEILAPNHPAEREARQVASGISDGRSVTPRVATPPAIARSPDNGDTEASTSRDDDALLAELLAGPGPRSFDDLWGEFIRHRYQGNTSEAIAVVPLLLDRMDADQAIRHGVDLALWLLDQGQRDLAEWALGELERGWWLRYALISETVPEPVGFGQAPEQLIDRAKTAARAGDHGLAAELFTLAFEFVQMQMELASSTRAEELRQFAQADMSPVMFRILFYSTMGDLVDQLREILGFYSRLGREAIAAGDTERTEEYFAQGATLRETLLRDHVISDERIVTMERTQEEDRRRGTGFTIHGVDDEEEFVTQLPGAPTPDEFGPAYAASLSELTEALAGQEALVADLYEHPEIVRAFGEAGPDLSERGDRLRVYRIVYEQAGGDLAVLLDTVERYLQHFTFHTEYNIRDFGVSYLSTDFPTDVAGLVVRDCGVYALTVAYEVYLTARNSTPQLPIDFRIYTTPDHATLVIFDRSNDRHFVVNNNEISGPFTGDVLASVAESYAEMSGLRAMATPAAAVDIGSTSMRPSRFQSHAWSRYRTVTQWGLGAEPERDPSSGRSEEDRVRARYAAFYEGRSGFNRTAIAIDQVVEEMERVVSGRGTAEQRSLLADRLARLVPLPTVAEGRDALEFFKEFGPSSQVVGPARVLRNIQPLYLYTGVSRTESHPFVRLGKALLYLQGLGQQLSPQQQGLLDRIRSISTFNSELTTYESSGRPLDF